MLREKQLQKIQILNSKFRENYVENYVHNQRLKIVYMY